MARAIESKFPWGGGAPTFGNVSVKYDAAAVEVGTTVGLNSGYPRSVNTGIDPGTGPEQFRQLIKECPNTKVILLGYSQGGHVIHEITIEAHRGRTQAHRYGCSRCRCDPQSGRRRITDLHGQTTPFETADLTYSMAWEQCEAVAMADTVCLANNSLTQSTSVIRRSLDSKLHHPHPFLRCYARGCSILGCGFSREVPDDLHYKVLNVCSSLDIICDAEVGSDGAKLGFNAYKAANLVGLLKGTSVHGEFYKTPGFYDPASWAAGKLKLPSLIAK
jgi:hypothetical protein